MIFNMIIYTITIILAWMGIIYVHLQEMDVENEDSK